MRILAIRFQNLNSLRGTHEVILASGPLASAGLFAITGPTGAGKSSILDAVTLALYGRAARYGRDTAEDMLSRSEAECSAAVDFECTNGRFTAKWLLRRARGRPDGKLQPAIHELSQDGVLLEDRTLRVVKRIVELTELDYDRFLRSVLLAQGEFAAFLKADRDQRADLLERITGSQIYSELGSLAHSISAGHAREIENETNRMKGIVFLTEEERNEVSETIAKVAEDLAAAEAKQMRLRTLVGAIQRAAEQEAQLKEIHTLAAAHARAEEEFAPLAARLARHAETEPFAEGIGELNEAVRVAASSAAARTTAEAQLSRAKELAGEAAGAAMACIAAGEATEAEIQRSISVTQRDAGVRHAAMCAWLTERAADSDLSGRLPQLSALAERAGFLIAQSHSAGASLTKARSDAESAAAKLTTLEAQASSAAVQATSASQALEKTRTALAVLLKEPWSTPAIIEKEIVRLTGVLDTVTRLAGTHAALAETEKRIAAELIEKATLRSRAASLADTARALQEKLDSAKQIEELLRARLADQQLIRSLEEHRAHLLPGEPCPLCGSKEHPWSDPAVLPADDSLEQRLRRQSAEVSDCAKLAAAALTEAVAAEKALTDFQARLHAREEALAGARSVMETEWQAIAPEQECTAQNLSAARDAWKAEHDAMMALLTKVRTAQDKERAAMTASVHAAAEAKMALAAREAAQQHSISCTVAVKEAESALTNARSVLAAHLAGVQKAFAEAGEPDAEDIHAAMARLHARARTWRENTAACAALEKELATLQRDSEKSLDSAKAWETRRRETMEVMRNASLAPVPGMTQPGEWSILSMNLTRAVTGFLAAERLLTSAMDADKQSAEMLGRRKEGLAEALRSSVFESIEDLCGARLDAATWRQLGERRDTLRDAGVRLNARREAILREREALLGGIERMTAAEGGGVTNQAGWEEALRQTTDFVRELQARSGGLRQRLQSDDDARARFAGAAIALEQKKLAAAPWMRLTELIGSADGDKFSRFAQSVTLDHLTALANARLAQLCDRYRLLRSGAAADLQLQICDAWQGDSLRPMESLSGGESFLVSLALALGLSELAGRRTRIGTLFIDEGFGTLDSTALDIALSALETLRTGHSTIAVISHVEALKTRLTTQVEVVRGAGGWSTLHVRT
jgi:exonuclease SbcC